jgi:hypothetical protein
MKKLYFLLFAPILSFSAQIEGTWKLAPQPGSLAVGPSVGSIEWWAIGITNSTPQDIITRACLFDDSIKFEANGTMTHYMDGATWLEDWQGSNPAACGAPVAPHVGGAATYSYDATAGTLTVNGLGAHLGLAKVFNGGELSVANPTATATSITYNVSISNGGNTMTLDINFGPGWWRFVYQRTVPLAVQDYDVTFRVDMSQYSGSLTNGVSVAGDFNGWNAASNPMSDNDGDGVWETTLPLAPGSIEYKFVASGSWENLTDGSSCTITDPSGQYTNRANTITGDVVFPKVCWESCAVCTYDVSFAVDMNDYITAGGSTAAGIFLNGSFNNWCGNCNPMTDANGDNVWEVTIPLSAGPIEYKFTEGTGASASWEAFAAGDPCTITDPSGQYTNRAYTVTTAASIPEVCWESCSDCLAGVEELNNSVAIYPNPVNSIMTIKATEAMQNIRILDLTGKVVATIAGNGLTQEINVDSLKAGVYTIQITTAAGNSAKQFVKK